MLRESLFEVSHSQTLHTLHKLYILHFFSYSTTDIIFERFVSKFDNLKIYNVEATDDLVGFRITARRSSLHSTLLLNQSAYIHDGMRWDDDEIHTTRTTLFFYKNLFYKNVEDEFCLKFKNSLRTLPRLRVG